MDVCCVGPSFLGYALVAGTRAEACFSSSRPPNARWFWGVAWEMWTAGVRPSFEEPATASICTRASADTEFYVLSSAHGIDGACMVDTRRGAVAHCRVPNLRRVFDSCS